MQHQGGIIVIRVTRGTKGLCLHTSNSHGTDLDQFCSMYNILQDTGRFSNKSVHFETFKCILLLRYFSVEVKIAQSDIGISSPTEDYVNSCLYMLLHISSIILVLP